MPPLYFYAIDDDYRLVLDSVFESQLGFRVFERQSAVNETIREFHSAEEVLQAWASGSAAGSGPPNLALLAPGNGHAPTFTRIDLREPGYERNDYDYRCEGWGLILMDFGTVRKGGVLDRSFTGHNSERRARGRADFYPRLGDPDAWDWAAVNSYSRTLNQRIRKAAIRSEGSRPVLPAAHQATVNGLTLDPM